VSWKQDKPETVVPVPVAGLVPVAIGRAAVPGVVVPTAATKHAVRASGQNPKPIYHISPQIFSASHPGELDQRLHVTDEFVYRPFSGFIVSFVRSEFANKPPLAPRGQPDFMRQDPISQKGNAI